MLWSGDGGCKNGDVGGRVVVMFIIVVGATCV